MHSSYLVVEPGRSPLSSSWAVVLAQPLAEILLNRNITEFDGNSMGFNGNIRITWKEILEIYTLFQQKMKKHMGILR